MGVELRRLDSPCPHEHIVLETRRAEKLSSGRDDYSRIIRFRDRSDPAAAIAGARRGSRQAPACTPAAIRFRSGKGRFSTCTLRTHARRPILSLNLVVKCCSRLPRLHRLDDLWSTSAAARVYWGSAKRFGAPSEITHLRLVPATA